MGRRRQGRGRGGGGSRGDTRGAGYRDVVKENENFEKYYNTLEIVGEDEKEQFWAAMRRELPNSFRFTGSRGHALIVQQRLIDDYIPQITSVTYNGDQVEPPRPIEWYPDQLAWSMTTPKNVVRKFPPFASFQKFLVSETSVGNISRQEIVSMIPPLLMDIHPGMTVLDLCAAPGSKTAQLVEMVHGGEEARVRKVLHKLAEEQGRGLSPDGMEVEEEMAQAEAEDDYSDDGRSTGLLIANDVDNRRAHLLIHQVKRLNSPNLIVTNHDASAYPSIELPTQSGKKKSYLKFDRILADVPCSGDGTARKNVNVWKDWNPGNGLGLFALQVRILVRALQMLKVGGRVVYSTCSLNPVENEAVVASAIERCGGSARVRVVDCSDALPALKRKPGLSDWKIIDKTGRIWSNWKEVEEAKAAQGEDGFSRVVEGMFPPESTSEEEKIPLERCMRVYPHLQDTGGFFITVLEKVTEIRARSEADNKKIVPMPPISALIEAIDNQDEKGNHAIPEELQGISEPALESHAGQDTSTAAHQNQEIPAAPKSPKRALEDDSEPSSPTKRIKTAPPQEQHWPPPPATALERAPDEGPKKKRAGPVEEPFKYLDSNQEDLMRIYDFYAIDSRFPRDRWMVRNATGQPVKTIYYTSALARDILTQNEGKGMKFVHCGVKMFMKQDAQGQDICRWRIQSEGMPIIEPWVGEGRTVRLFKQPTLRKLLIEMFPKVGNGGWEELGEVGERVRDISMGCCILRVETSDAQDGFKERLVLPLWRGMASLNLMLPKEERKALLLRLFNDDSPLIDHSKKKFGKTQNGDNAPSPDLDGDEPAGEAMDEQPEPANAETNGGTEEVEPEAVEVAEEA